MTKILNGTPVSAPITPGSDDQNVWPTHFAKYGSGGLELLDTPSQLDDIKMERREDKVALVKDDGTGSPAFYEWSASKWNKVDLVSSQHIKQHDDLVILSTMNDLANYQGDPTGKLFFVKTGQDGKPTMYGHTGVSYVPYDLGKFKGIKVSDGKGVSKVDITEVEFPNANIVDDPLNGAAKVMIDTLHTFGTKGDPSSYSKGNKVSFKAPLKAFSDPDESSAILVEIEEKHEQTLPSSLRYLSTAHFMLDHRHSLDDGSIFFDYPVYDNDNILADPKTGGYMIQVDKGLDYLVSFRLHMEGVALNNGIVKIYLRNSDPNNPADYLLDGNGVPMGTERYYKKGETLGTLEITGVVSSNTNISFKTCIESELGGSVRIGDRANGASGLLIQAIGSKAHSGDAMQQFELDTGMQIRFNRYDLGSNRFSLLPNLATDRRAELLQTGHTIQTAEGWHFGILEPLQFKIENNALIFEDDGSHPMSFDIGKVIDAEETQILRGHTIDLTVVANNQQGAYAVHLLTWSGTPDAYGTPIITGFKDGSPTLQTGWGVVDSKFIPQSSLSGSVTTNATFTVPAEANNLALLLAPTNPGTPDMLTVYDMAYSVNPELKGYFVKVSEPLLKKEAQFTFDEKTKDFEAGYGTRFRDHDLVYDINNVPDGTAMPIGVEKAGDAAVSIDQSVNQNPNTDIHIFEGALSFAKEGNAYVDTVVRVWNRAAGGVPVTTKFWWVKFDDQGNETKVKNSETTFDVPDSTTGTLFSLNELRIKGQPGDRYGLKASADMDSGVYMKCVTANQPMVSTHVVFDSLEIFSGTGDDPLPPQPPKGPFDDLNLDQFDSTYEHVMVATKEVTNVANTTLTIDVPKGLTISVLEAIKKTTTDDVVRPVRNLDWSYNNKTKELTVAFGETVETAAITIGIYAA